ncbi:hypothetical protein HYZ80_02740 [Candidatus Parcubacteria bacterium]|nr:hypothetical protein [Candidatus Parcubacteria bacterium]
MAPYQRLISWTGAALVLGALGLGFVVAGSPQRARDFRADEERLQNLQQIVSSIQSYYDDKGSLPATLETLLAAGRLFGGEAVRHDPITKEAYDYRIAGAKTFELCATFVLSSKDGRGRELRAIPVGPGKTGFVNWDHPAGRHCFSIEVSESGKPNREQ